MIQASSHQIPRRGRVFPERQISKEELEQRRAEKEAFSQRCRLVFDSVKPELINDHYDWFIVIEPDSGDYFIDPDEKVARAKAAEKHPGKLRLIMRINETGTCGRI